jgi:hypothetical protein
LLEERPVDPQALLQGGDRGGIRLIAEDDQSRITRHDADDDEDQRQHGKQRDNRKHQTLDEKGAHSGPEPPGKKGRAAWPARICITA